MPPKPDAGGRNAYAGVVMGSDSGTPVAAQRIWQEHVAKEIKHQVVRTDYTRNPKTVLCLPEKPCDRRRELALRQDPAAEGERAAVLEALAAKDPQAHADVMGLLQRADASPRRKSAHPLTSANEIGWDVAFAARHRAEADHYTRPHTSADVTRFADAYVANNGYNHFSTKQFKYLAKAGANKK